jgi:hypothetical protein
MCWTSLYTGNKTNTNKIKKTHTTQYVLDITIHKKQDEYKQNLKKTQNTICVGHHYTQETRRIQTKLKKTHTTQYVLDITIHRKQDEYKQN